MDGCEASEVGVDDGFGLRLGVILLFALGRTAHALPFAGGRPAHAPPCASALLARVLPCALARNGPHSLDQSPRHTPVLDPHVPLRIRYSTMKNHLQERQTRSMALSPAHNGTYALALVADRLVGSTVCVLL